MVIYRIDEKIQIKVSKAFEYEKIKPYDKENT
jgi:hypothetical protein